MKLGIGLIVKGGEEFIEKWIKAIEKFADIILVIDNGADILVRNWLITHPKIKQYHIQKNMDRNQSRDYQKILEMAREEECNWIWNIDIDEIVEDFVKLLFESHLLNTKDTSVGFPLFEMRDDEKHYVMVRDGDSSLKHARLVHKCYKVLSHFKFDEKDIHGCSIPHNCTPGEMYPILIKHFGHYTKKLREEKRKQFATEEYKDKAESYNTWLEEDPKKIVIKEWENWKK